MFLPAQFHLPGPGPQQRAACTGMCSGSWMTSPLTGTIRLLSCHYAPETHTHTQKTVSATPTGPIPFLHSFSISPPFSLRLTCSLLQLSAADTMISSSSKRTSESLFRQTAEEVCTFFVSHNYKKHSKDGKQT